MPKSVCVVLYVHLVCLLNATLCPLLEHSKVFRLLSFTQEKLSLEASNVHGNHVIHIIKLKSVPTSRVISPSGVTRNCMKIRPANRISEISADAQHFLQDCMCTQRPSKESLDVWLISAKQ